MIVSATCVAGRIEVLNRPDRRNMVEVWNGNGCASRGAVALGMPALGRFISGVRVHPLARMSKYSALWLDV